MPTSGNPTSTMMMPPKKAMDPLILCFWKKNRNVRSKPITQASPHKNRICKTEGILVEMAVELYSNHTHIAYGQ